MVCKFKYRFIANSTPIGLRSETLIIECTQLAKNFVDGTFEIEIAGITNL